MVRYRRVRLTGGTYFFTLTLKDRRSDLLVRHIALLREALRRVMQRRPFAVPAAVIMPDHLHLLMKLPEGTATTRHACTISRRALSGRCGQRTHP